MKTKIKIWLYCTVLATLMCFACEPEQYDTAPKIPTGKFHYEIW